MGKETSTKLRSSSGTKENGTNRGGTSASASTESPASPSSHATLGYVFLFLLVDLLGFTVILPLIPSLLEYYNNHDEVSMVHYLVLLTCIRLIFRNILPLYVRTLIFMVVMYYVVVMY